MVAYRAISSMHKFLPVNTERTRSKYRTPSVPQITEECPPPAPCHSTASRPVYFRTILLCSYSYPTPVHPQPSPPPLTFFEFKQPSSLGMRSGTSSPTTKTSHRLWFFECKKRCRLFSSVLLPELHREKSLFTIKRSRTAAQVIMERRSLIQRWTIQKSKRHFYFSCVFSLRILAVGPRRYQSFTSMRRPLLNCTHTPLPARLLKNPVCCHARYQQGAELK